MAACANVVGPAFTEGTQPDVEAPAHHRRRGLLSDLRHARWPPARAGRAGDEVRPQPAARARPARARSPLCEWPGRAPAAGDRVPRRDLHGASRWRNGWRGWRTLDVCYGPVNTLPEAIDDPNLLKRGAIVIADDGRKHFAPAVRFRDEPSQPLYREPLLGEHTRRGPRRQSAVVRAHPASSRTPREAPCRSRAGRSTAGRRPHCPAIVPRASLHRHRWGSGSHDQAIPRPLRRPDRARERRPRRHARQRAPLSQRAPDRGFWTARDVAQLMDELGYYALWTAEHHFQHEGYECFPNLIQLGAVARHPDQAPEVRLRLQRAADVASRSAWPRTTRWPTS